MPFENISKRKLAFAPKIVVVPQDQKAFSFALHEISFAHTQHISGAGKMLPVMGLVKAGEFEKLPELLRIEGHLALPQGLTVLAAKLVRIDGDLHVAESARFYAPLLEEVTGFIYLGEHAVLNAPRIEHLLSNDDTSKIKEQKEANWLDSLAN